MRFQLALAALAPLALAAPFWGKAEEDIPEMSLNEWSTIQSGFIEGAKSLAGWSWNTAAEIAEELEYEDEEKTAWGKLQEDPQFSKLVKIIKFEKDAIKYLDDKDAHGTLFAPNDDALTPPEHRRGHHGHHGHHVELTEASSLLDVSAWIDAQPVCILEGGGDDDDKRKKWREIIRKIVGKILMYHALEGGHSSDDLALNSTFPTVLKAEDGSYGGLHRRIKVERTWIPPSASPAHASLVPPDREELIAGIKINGYAKVVRADIKASNGYIHAIDHPLLPPPSIIDEAFLFPDFFSTATSSIQKVHGTKYLDWEYDREASKPGHPKFKGMPLTTFFLPSNLAFGLLPPRLKFFLFSPFGERALYSILAYHAVPGYLLLSEFVHHEKTKSTMTLADDPNFHKEFDVPTAWNDTTLHIEVDKTKFKFGKQGVVISMKANGVKVDTIDVQARNGAVQVINKVLVPPHKHQDEFGEDISHLDDWENWEQWIHTL